MKTTRECSAVLFKMPEPGQEVKFAKREFEVAKWLPCVKYKSKKRIDSTTVWRQLVTKQRELELLRYPEKEEKKAKPKKTWEDKVNERRQLAAYYFHSLVRPTIAEVSKMAGCGRKLAKEVMHDVLAFGRPLPYSYPNVKPREQVEELDRTIAEVRGSFSTITDIKRRHCAFSKKWIGRRLHGSGFRWLKMTRRLRHPGPDLHRSSRVKAVVKHLAQAITHTDVVNVYVDEVHFMLTQTATHNWRNDNQAEDDMVYNRRPWPEKAKLTCIAACTLKGFLAVQVFRQDINADEFLYFLQEILMKMPRGQKVSVLADNATCHSASLVQKSRAGKFLFMNSPGLFRANAIENAFSFVKAEWRKRPQVCTYEEEAQQLARIFFDGVNEKRFLGIAFNHARSLVGLCRLNFGDMEESSREEGSSDDEDRGQGSLRMTKGSRSVSVRSERSSFEMDVE